MKTGILLAAAVLAAGASAPAAAQCDLTGVLPGETLVYHGTPVGMFTWRDPSLNPAPPFAHPRAPDGPAWFAENWQFSVHAGLRYLLTRSDTTLHLYRYRVRRDLAMLICPDRNQLSIATGIPATLDDYAFAQRFCREQSGQYNGYTIRRDAVRGEPEHILCVPAEYLIYAEARGWPVQQVRDGAYRYTGATGEDFSGQSWACLLDNTSLQRFWCSSFTEVARGRAAAP